MTHKNTGNPSLMSSLDGMPHPEEFPDLFQASMEQVRPDSIYTISPDEYGQLASLSAEEARDLPDGLYVIEETIRDSLKASGISYEQLSRAVLSAMGTTSVDPNARDLLGIGRHNSSHHVFAGGLEMSSRRGTSTESLIMIKTHIEGAKNVAKPYQELGNLALLQSLGQEGVYRPVALLQTGNLRFVLTEFRSGVRTIDDHTWYGRRGSARERAELAKTYDRDIELIGRAFGLLGSLHAQGVFHGDAQSRNIGWTSLEFGEQSDAVQIETTLPSRVSELANIKMTVVDVENSKVFHREGGDFSAEYYRQLPELAVEDLVKLFGSLPKGVRISPGGRQNVEHDETDFLTEAFVRPYAEAFIAKRMELFGPDTNEEELSVLLSGRMLTALKAVNDSQRPQKRRIAQVAA